MDETTTARQPTNFNFKMLDYPVATTMAGVLIMTALLLLVAKRLDATQGVLTISILVVLGFLGVIVVSVLFTIPHDESTAAVIGGLVAAFGAVVAYWLGGRDRGGI
jgi:hypothetical protein